MKVFAKRPLFPILVLSLMSEPALPVSPPPLPEAAVIVLDSRNQTIVRLQADDLSAALEQRPDIQDGLATSQFGTVALEFIGLYRRLFRLADPVAELKVSSTAIDNIGYKHVRLEQYFAGMPVLGAELIVHFNQDNRIYLVNGHYAPTPEGLVSTPALGKQEAMKILAARIPQMKNCLAQCKTDLIVFYDSASSPQLAYRIATNPGILEGREIVMDAETGKILQETPLGFRR
jgi:hypothetical protein